MKGDLLDTAYGNILIIYGHNDSGGCEIRQVLSYPLGFVDIKPYYGSFYRTVAKYDRIFLQPDVDDYGHLTCVMVEMPQEVEGEVGYHFNSDTKTWDKFDVEDWMEEIGNE